MLPEHRNDPLAANGLLAFRCAQFNPTKTHSGDHSNHSFITILEKVEDDHPTDEIRRSLLMPLDLCANVQLSKKYNLPTARYFKLADGFRDLGYACIVSASFTVLKAKKNQ
ncbi:hypothetical protein IVA94_12250 [Bradyrhizobium sp. 156]|uniref:hypothetical protein n=1 Tax=Bradyrhizobium sp. 156 TaxID=2782630 RepID=UPI001FF8CD14|nr:hypothetical protein [Bradyrhizobium sp. 156]MCK1321652.1 hypothetical protein [Bradyrhizobium sp. 156]